MKSPGWRSAPATSDWPAPANDLIVKVWDLRTGKQSLGLDIVERRANGLAFSPDGQLLAVGSADGVVQILDGTPLKRPGDAGQLLTLKGHSDMVTGLAYSPDGRRVASASRDGTAKVWNADSGREVLTFRGHRAALTAVAWTPDGRRVASASWDGTARVWDATTGTEIFPPLDARRRAGVRHRVQPDRHRTRHRTPRRECAGVGRRRPGNRWFASRTAHDPARARRGIQPRRRTTRFRRRRATTRSKSGTGRRTPRSPCGLWRRRRTSSEIRCYSPDGKRLVAVVATPARVWTWDMTTTTGEGHVRRSTEYVEGRHKHCSARAAGWRS